MFFLSIRFSKHNFKEIVYLFLGKNQGILKIRS
jgi:hypothetical protein